MRRSRALTVRIMAGVALAATLVGLSVPAARLWAQKPGPAPSPVPEIPTSPPTDSTLPLPGRAEYIDPASAPRFLENPPTAMPPKESAPVLPSPSSPASSAASIDDPEGSARTFVEKSQKEADDAIKALTREAETLRARLQKVEAGLARWQAVKGALESHGGGRQGWRSPDEMNPQIMDAVPGPVVTPPAVRSAPGRGRRGVVPAPDRSPFENEPAPTPRRDPDADPDLSPAPKSDNPLPPARSAPSTPRRVTPEPAGDQPKTTVE